MEELLEGGGLVGNEVVVIGGEQGQFNYNPDQLLDVLRDHLKLKNDAALCRALEVAPPIVSKIRHRRIPVGAAMLIRMHEVSGLSIRDLRFLMGDRRDKFVAAEV